MILEPPRIVQIFVIYMIINSYQRQPSIFEDKKRQTRLKRNLTLNKDIGRSLCLGNNNCSVISSTGFVFSHINDCLNLVRKTIKHQLKRRACVHPQHNPSLFCSFPFFI